MEELQLQQTHHHHHHHYSASASKSKYVLKYSALYFRLCYAVKTSPFDWPVPDPERLNNPLTLRQSTSNRIAHLAWLFVSLSHISYTCFLVASLYLHLDEYLGNTDFLAAVLHVAWCCGHGVISCIRVHQLQRKYEMLYSTNQMIRFVSDVIYSDPNCANGYLKRWRIFDKIMLAASGLLAIGPACCGCFVIIFPYHHRYVYLLFLPSTIQVTWYIKLIFFVIESIFCYYTWAVLFTENFMAIFFIDNMGASLRLLTKRKESSAQSVEQMAKMYQQLHLLDTLFHEAFSGSFGIPATKLMCTLTALSCIAIGIRLYDQINPFVTAFLNAASLSCLGVLGLLLPLSAKVYEKSHGFCFPNFARAEPGESIGSENKKLSSYERKLVCSCKPFAVRIGDMYLVTRSTVLTYLSIFLGNLVNILIGMSSY